MKKEDILYIIGFLDNIINTVGNTITEYHWREACALIKILTDEYPEYKLDKEIKIIYLKKRI